VSRFDDEFGEVLAAGAKAMPARLEPVALARRRPSYARRRRKLPYVISLNLTAMIDTVFNLLFLFIMISRFGALEGTLPAKLPARVAQAAVAGGEEVPRIPIRIRLVPDAVNPYRCRATIDRFFESPLEMNGLAPAMRRIRDMGVGFDRQTPVHLLARDDVAWDHVVNAYNAAVAAEFEKVYFAANP
jgi:biopolymer transport protein ExbD